MENTSQQALVQKMNLVETQVSALTQQIQKRMLSTSDRKFLYELVTKIVKPAIADSNIPAGAIALVAASQIVLQQNELRWCAWIINAGLNDAFLTFVNQAAGVTTGATLKPGGTAVFGRGTDSPHLGTVTAISNAAGTTLTFVEWSVPYAELEF
jgi:hypothetical protein